MLRAVFTFSSKSLLNNPLGFTDSLRDTYYRHPALPPVMPWLDSIPPNPPPNLTATVAENAITLNWEAPPMAKDSEPVYGYVIYRFDADDKVDIGDPKYILHIQYNDTPFYKDETAQKGKTYFYVVTALDRLKNESEPSPVISATSN